MRVIINSSRKSIDRVEELTGKKIIFYEEDLLNEKALDDIFDKEKIDSVIHFAALKAVGESCEIPLRYFDNNLTGTLNLLKVMEKHNVKSLVFSSSATVYGKPETVPIKEDFPLSVLYISLMAERSLLRRICSGIYTNLTMSGILRF